MNTRTSSISARGVTSLSGVTGSPLRRTLLASTALALAMMLPAAGPAGAQDATWETNPGSGNFYDPVNWNPVSIPTGTATFGASNTTALTLGSSGSFGGWTFNAGAPNYTFTIAAARSQDFTGAGITINGGSATIANNGTLSFANTSTAGGAGITNNAALNFRDTSTAGGAMITNSSLSSNLEFLSSSTAGSATITNDGFLFFRDTSTAGSAAITNNTFMRFFNTSTAGSANITNNSSLNFLNSSTAGNSTISNNGLMQFHNGSTAGSASITTGSLMEFYNTSTAGSATITNNAFLNFFDTSTAGSATITNSGNLNFNDNSNAGSATITSNGTLTFRDTSTAGSATITNSGTLRFLDVSSGGNAAIISQAGGTVDISGVDTSTTAGSIAGAGDFILGSNRLIVGSNDLTTEVSGVISGIGGRLDKTGAGTLTLTGANTYTGGTTITSASSSSRSTLQLGNASQAGSILGPVTVGNWSTLAVVNADMSGTTIANNSGYVSFYNTSTAGSATITNNTFGSLSFNNASTAGNATIANDGGLSFVNASTAGSAAIINNGNLQFDQNSTAGSATITNNNDMYFSDSSTAGSANITSNTNIAFHQNSSSGNATIANNGGLYFHDTSNAGSATITNTGNLNFYNTSTAGSATITTTNTLEFENASTAGNATITNSGLLRFANTSTAGSAAIANTGTMRFYHTGTAGSAAITNNADLEFYDFSTAGGATITNNANLRFDDSSTGGSATLINNAGGTVDFSGSTGAAGDGKLSAGSIAGAGNYILGARDLTVGSNNLSTTVSGVISGTGSLVKVGTGTLTLAGNNTYTGPTTVLGGVLNIAGALSGTTAISSGGRIAGDGTLGTVNVGNGGILSPGNSIGSITIATLNVGAGAFYDVELSDGGNAPGVHSDLINVTGVATFNSGLSIRVTPENGTDNGNGYIPGTVYTVLRTVTPGDLTFNGALDVTDSFAFLDFTGSHDSQNLYLTSRLLTTTFCQAGLGANQCGAGGAAFALGWGNDVFDAMLVLDQDDVAGALASISGETHASVQSVIDQTFAQLGRTLTDRSSDGVAALKAAMQPLGYMARPSGAGVVAIDGAMLSPVQASAWLTPLGGQGHVAADANAAALDWWHGGLAGGYQVTGDNALAGLAFGYQRGSASVAARQSQTTLDSFMLGTYGALTDGANALAGALTLGTSRVSTHRTVTVGGLTNQAGAEYWTHSVGLSLEASHDLELGNGTTLSPLATLGLGWSGHGGFTETGAGALNLTAAARGAIHLDAGIGLGLSHVIETEDGALTLSARAAWEHSFTETPGQSMTFAGGTTPFIIQGPSAGSDRLRLGAGLSFDANDGLMMGLNYDGSFSASERVHKANASIGVQF